MTRREPRNPWIDGATDTHPKLVTKSGMARGSTTRTAQMRRPGRSVRSMHHAAATPITAQAAVTASDSRTVFQRRFRVSWRKSRCERVAQPVWAASMRR